MNITKEQLQVSIRECGDVTILDLRGRSTIDDGETDLLTRQLHDLVARGKRKLLLNLADLTQVDTTGISAIVEAYLYLERHGGKLKLLGPCGRVLEVLTVFRLLDAIPSFEDETQALASFWTGVDAERLEVVGAEGNTTSHTDRFWKAVNHWEKDQPEIFLEFSGPIEGIFKGTVARIKGKTVTFRDVETEEELRVNFDEATVRFHSFSRLDAVCSFCALWMDESTLQTAKCVLTESPV